MKMRERIEQLEKEIRFLKSESMLIKNENEKIYQENVMLCKRCLRLDKRNEELKSKKAFLEYQHKEEIEKLKKDLKKCQSLLSVYKDHVEEVSLEELLEEI